MKQNNLGRFLIVAAIVLWSLWQVYPPTSRDLIQQFSSRAENKDAAFTNILKHAEALQATGTNNEFISLQLATGTNDLQKYFPFISAKAEIHPNLYILNRLQRDATGKIKLGLDLQGGTSFLVQMDTSKLANTNDTAEALSQAIQVLRKRIDRFGVAEPVIQSAGHNRILIQLPGLSQSEKESARREIQRAAFLEFRMVNPRSDEIIKNGDPIPMGYMLMKQIEHLPGNKTQVTEYVVKKTPANGLSGDIVKNAMAIRGNLGQPQIEFTLTDDGARKFAQVTKANVGRQMAIILDGQLYSAPVINSPIETGEGEITGHFTMQQALELANVLQNPLKAPLKIVYSSDVGATLGKDSIESGIRASIYSVIFVCGFMLLYYLFAGLAANVALMTNVIILLGVMCSIGTTFTLPGIAGGVLTIGMAVDANVLIYERIREELALGKTLRGGIEAGYARAFSTVFDSHITTLISSVILIFMGTGEVKGFGVTLTIGVAASLFTALIVTRLIFNFMVNRNLLKSLPMLHIIRSTKINFMGVAKPVFILTWLFVISSVGFGLTRGKHLFGVDFLGGDSATYTYTQKPQEKNVRAVLSGVGIKDATIQFQKDMSSGLETLRVTTPPGTESKAQTALEKQIPQAHLNVLSKQHVGAVIGKQIQQSAIVASLLALFGILVYVAFRYEFSFAVAAVVAVIHDILLTIGAYCIANATSGRQFNATVVAALLTIIGFSINDTIVIFDRIREDLKLGVRGSFKEIINQALNQTLSRTIITSGTVFLATLSLYIFGGGVINDFAFTFLVGILTGTYSSIYIASALVLWWHKGHRPSIGAKPVSVQGMPAVK